MRAVQVTQFAGPEALHPCSLPEPQPGHGDVVVQHDFIGVNYVDTQHRRGTPYAVALPLIPGIEAAGRIVDVGDGVEDLAIGQRVAYGGIMPGVYAELAVVPAEQTVPIPDRVPSELAAGVLVQGWTAHMLATLTNESATPHDAVVVFAAAGGTGSLLVQLLVADGRRVVGITSSAQKCAYVTGLGAEAIDRSDVDVVDEVRSRTNGGASVVFDGVSGTAFDQARRMLRPAGHLVAYGQSGGPAPAIDPAVLSGIHPIGGPGSLSVTWPTLNDHNATPEIRRRRSAHIFDRLAKGTLQVRVDSSLGLLDAAEAHRRLEAGDVIGKLVLDANR